MEENVEGEVRTAEAILEGKDVYQFTDMDCRSSAHRIGTIRSA